MKLIIRTTATTGVFYKIVPLEYIKKYPNFYFQNESIVFKGKNKDAFKRFNILTKRIID